MFRTLVSRSRRRFQDGQYDIDLTYICPNRLIVMSFPGQGTIETQYRNDCVKVKEFLQEKHGDKYYVFNVSEKKYEKSRFDGRVSDYNWQDHHAPPFHLLFNLVEEMKNWLNADPENVVVIHCNSGKGRAGTATCCLLVFLGFYDSVYEAAKLFSSRRFTDGKGISQPCQVRFIHYFQAFYERKVISPQIKYLKRITIRDVPLTSSLSDGCNKPFYEVYQVDGLNQIKIYTNKDDADQVKFYFKEEGIIDLKLPGRLKLYGNIMIRFKYHNTFSCSDLFRVTFNTAFIGSDNVIETSRFHISPEALQKDYEKFSLSFSCTLFFQDYCKLGCRSNVTPIDQICERCKSIMLDEVDKWYQATKILDNHKRNSLEEANALIQDMDELREVAMNQKLKWEPEGFAIDDELFKRPPRKIFRSGKSRSSTIDESKSIDNQKHLKSPLEVRSHGAESFKEADSDMTSVYSNAQTVRNVLQHTDYKTPSVTNPAGKFDFKASKNAKFGRRPNVSSVTIDKTVQDAINAKKIEEYKPQKEDTNDLGISTMESSGKDSKANFLQSINKNIEQIEKKSQMKNPQHYKVASKSSIVQQTRITSKKEPQRRRQEFASKNETLSSVSDDSDESNDNNLIGKMLEKQVAGDPDDPFELRNQNFRISFVGQNNQVAMQKHIESISNMQSVGYSPCQRYETPIKSSNQESMDGKNTDNVTDNNIQSNYFALKKNVSAIVTPQPKRELETQNNNLSDSSPSEDFQNQIIQKVSKQPLEQNVVESDT